MKRRRKYQPTMTLHVDTREQDPYTFGNVESQLSWGLEVATLQTGDYQLGGLLHGTPVSGVYEAPQRLDTQNQIVIERKTLADLYQSVGKHRERFEREWERMAFYGYAAVVIEAELSQIANPNEHLRVPTQMSPRSVILTLTAWSQRYGVHVCYIPGRRFAEQFTFRLLERWALDTLEGKRPHKNKQRPNVRTTI